jgi:hypothetical protein
LLRRFVVCVALVSCPFGLSVVAIYDCGLMPFAFAAAVVASQVRFLTYSICVVSGRLRERLPFAWILAPFRASVTVVLLFFADCTLTRASAV